MYVEIVLVSYCFVLIYITRDCYVMSLLIRIETELILIKKYIYIKNITSPIFSQPRYKISKVSEILVVQKHGNIDENTYKMSISETIE